MTSSTTQIMDDIFYDPSTFSRKSQYVVRGEENSEEYVNLQVLEAAPLHKREQLFQAPGTRPLHTQPGRAKCCCVHNFSVHQRSDVGFRLSSELVDGLWLIRSLAYPHSCG